MRCEEADVLAGNRLVSPSADRNKAPIAGVLAKILPETGTVLEIASGTGQHTVHFARAMTKLVWQPSVREPECLRSIAGWLAAESLPNVNEPLDLDVGAKVWPITSAAAVVCINMIHIAPWSAAEALFRGSRAILSSGGILFLYGPYRRQGKHTSPGNEGFDRQLRERNPEWGVRNLEDVALFAGTQGFNLYETHDMPANNLSVVFRER
jgi:hypothetical protein